LSSEVLLLRSSKALQLLTGLAGAKREPRSERRYSEQRSGSRVISSDGKARLRAQCQRIGMFGPIDMDLERLVDELWCGNHGLGDVSRFLLRALDNDESAARKEFSKFLQGKLSDRLLKLSRRAVGKDGRPHRHGRSLGARGRTMNGSKQPGTGAPSWPAVGATGP
jgi:hypothetical protein